MANTLYDLNLFQRGLLWLKNGLLSIPRAIIGFVRVLCRGIVALFRGLGRQLSGLWEALCHGDAFTRLSFLVMGASHLRRGQIVKGLMYLVSQGLFILYLTLFGAVYLKNIGTLGTKAKVEVWDEELQIFRYEPGDNSMLILLYGVLTILLIAAFVFVYIHSIRSGYAVQKLKQVGGRPTTFKEDIAALLDQKFHATLLTVPTVLVFAFTILPLLFMVLIAFTNFDASHQPPGNLFTWTGFQVFRELLWDDPLKSYTLFHLLGWTLIWAVFATFTNYIFGMLLALMINKRGIRLKSMWRTLFVVTIAVPQFVSLMLMSKVLNDQGVVNTLLQQLGWIDAPIRFLSDATLARISVIVINMWVGIPYTLLIPTGILMNIPDELYESAKIDGASPFKTFTRITMPYMLFVTTPYLITQFVGNLNNFNVIFLLTGGEPYTLEDFRAGKTDLLVTWLYKQTVTFQNYNLASAIGVLVFILTAAFSLWVYNSSGSVKREGEFR